MNLKLLLVGVLAIILLVLYFYSVKLEIDVATACNNISKPVPETAPEACKKAVAWSGNFGYILSGVGGMIAALAISALAVTEPGGTPNKGLTDGLSGTPELIAKIIPIAFVVTWLICGVLALYYGSRYTGSTVLQEMGKNWFGSVVAGVGAWLGVNPQQSAPPPNN